MRADEEARIYEGWVMEKMTEELCLFHEGGFLGSWFTVGIGMVGIGTLWVCLHAKYVRFGGNGINSGKSRDRVSMTSLGWIV